MSDIERDPETLEFEDLPDDSIQDGEEIPKEVRKLRTQAYDKAVSDLVDMIRSQDLVLDPDYQRNYIWDNKRASLLVESVLLNVPIPVIYVAEDDDGKWVIVDGLQRLNSLRRYFDNEYKLRNLEILDDLNKTQFSNLNPKARRLLKNGILRVIVIKAESHPEIKYDIFQRLNRGAVSLNEQELRNCMYRGEFCNLLKELREYPPFLKAIGIEKPHKRYYDTELILRFLALQSSYSPSEGKVTAYPNKMKTFLNRFMLKHQHAEADTLRHFSSTFRDTIDKVVAIIPPPSFRRFKPEDGTIDTRLNRALMDAIMVAFANHDANFLSNKKSEVTALYRNLPMEASGFNDALIYGTSDTKKLELRLNTWHAALGELKD
ncbi:MAG: DUF262 domain-containing protein [Candidatus Zixiibacteriota bacterium]